MEEDAKYNLCIEAEKLIEGFESTIKDKGVMIAPFTDFNSSLRDFIDASALKCLENTIPEAVTKCLEGPLSEQSKKFGMYIVNSKTEYFIYTWNVRLMTEEEKMQRKILKEMGIEK